MTAEALRRRMVREQIASRGLRDERLLGALEGVPRHLFVPPERRDQAYEDRPLEIGWDQTISQPYMVACMTQALALKGGERVLEIGTGSGYQTAVLLAMGAGVYSMERIPELSAAARAALDETGRRGALLRVGDGTLGWPEQAPFDRILITAGAPSIPLTLLQQLREGGTMVVPVGGAEGQQLMVVRRENGLVTRSEICACTFVKLLGQEGW